MTRTPSIEALALDEQRTRNRVAIQRAKVYRGAIATPRTGRMQPDALLRAHRAAQHRLAGGRSRMQ